jgi:putative nucleotidyltransferase with HDIG domain
MLSLDVRSERWFEELVDLVGHEPTYAARVLAMANSAAYGGTTPITSIPDAVLRMGASTVTQLVVALSVVRVFVPAQAWERSLWTHAITVATTARALACRVDLGGGFRPDDAYLCGLLHDLGRFLLFQEAPDAFRRIEEADWSNPADLVAAEVAICGMDHAALGAAAARRWKLPDAIVEVVARHHRKSVDRDPLSKLVSLIQAADRLDFFEVSPNHQQGEARPPQTDAALESRLRVVLPGWYPHAPGAVMPWVQAAEEEARHAVQALLPSGIRKA